MTTPAGAAAFVAEANGVDHQQVMRQAVNAVAEARGLPAPWPASLPGTLASRLTKRLADLGDDLATWGGRELGALREELLSSHERSTSGTWYTPPEVARPLTEAALSTITDHLYLDDDPTHLLNTSALDPACGAGVFLIAAARFLAGAYAGMLYGTHHPAPLTVQAVLPEVMRTCIFGIDTDPVAVDLAKSVCWLECAGTPSIHWLDDNIATGNALDGDLPPALADRLHQGPLAVVGNPPYKDKAKGCAPWIEARRPGPRTARTPDELYRPSLDEFRVPGQGNVEKSLSNLYIYFWRWALWRVCETRLQPGCIAFLTPSAWLASPTFAGMRRELRRAADQGLVIDLTPEGLQPPITTRLFPGVSIPLCAAIFTRRAGPNPNEPAHVRHATVHGSRADKVQRIEELLRLSP